MSNRTIKDSVRALAGGEAGYRPLASVPPVGARPGGVAVGRPGAGTGGQGQAVGAFTETDYTLRQYWPERVTATSSDGLFVLLDQPIKSIDLEQGGPATFKEPVE